MTKKIILLTSILAQNILNWQNNNLAHLICKSIKKALKGTKMVGRVQISNPSQLNYLRLGEDAKVSLDEKLRSAELGRGSSRGFVEVGRVD